MMRISRINEPTAKVFLCVIVKKAGYGPDRWVEVLPSSDVCPADFHPTGRSPDCMKDSDESLSPMCAEYSGPRLSPG